MFIENKLSAFFFFIFEEDRLRIFIAKNHFLHAAQKTRRKIPPGKNWNDKKSL